MVAPLNWGLGHASRCIPVIDALIKYDFQPILAGDGESLELLRKEFPELKHYQLPSTKVTYSEKGSLLKFKLLSQAPKVMRSAQLEKKRIAEIHKIEKLSGIISDNRFGVRSTEVPSVYMTHQIQVLSGGTSSLTSSYHQKIISKFTECWVPDYESNGLAGKLSNPGNTNLNIKYLGPLSRFDYRSQKKVWDIVAVLSGPQPQRAILEEKIKRELISFSGKSLLIQGTVENEQKVRSERNLTIVNFMLHQELEEAILSAQVIIARSGYSTVMDLEALQSRAFFIPTPGQFEQEYLANHLKERGFSDCSDQESFHLGKLNDQNHFEGFRQKKTSKSKLNRSLFDVFN